MCRALGHDGRKVYKSMWPLRLMIMGRSCSCFVQVIVWGFVVKVLPELAGLLQADNGMNQPGVFNHVL